MSVSKYSETSERHYEENSNGFMAAFYVKEEIIVNDIIDWIDSCEPSEKYYHLIYSDPEKWDMYIYYQPENNEDKIYESFKFCIVERTVKVYIQTKAAVDETPADYVLIRIQAPLRGLWPNLSELYIDDRQIEFMDQFQQETEFFIID